MCFLSTVMTGPITGTHTLQHRYPAYTFTHQSWQDQSPELTHYNTDIQHAHSLISHDRTNHRNSHITTQISSMHVHSSVMTGPITGTHTLQHRYPACTFTHQSWQDQSPELTHYNTDIQHARSPISHDRTNHPKLTHYNTDIRHARSLISHDRTNHRNSHITTQISSMHVHSSVMTGPITRTHTLQHIHPACTFSPQS